MTIQQCKDFSDLCDAVLMYGKSAEAAAKKAKTVKKCSPRVIVGDKSHYILCLEKYPNHTEVIDQLANNL